MSSFFASGHTAARISLLLPLALVVGLARTAVADDLIVGSSNTAIARGNATNGNFQFIAACGGQPQSIAIDGDIVFFGDALGRIYRFDGVAQQLTLFADTTSDATGLAVRGNELLIGGTDATIRRLNKFTAAELGSWPLTHEVTSMSIIGDQLFVGAMSGLITRLDFNGGTTGFFGTCSGPVAAVTADATHLIVGAATGHIFRMNLATGLTEGIFFVESDCTDLAIHFGSLLVSGTNGRILRVNRVTGAPQGFLQWNFDIQTMGLAPSSSGNPYCYGITCPCGNSDAVAGCKNSTGVGSYLGVNGSTSVSADDLSLTVTNMPPNSMGRLYMGASLVQIPFGDGLLCAGSGGYGQFRFPVQPAGAEGGFTFGPGVVAWSQSHFGQLGQIVPGFTWHFQGWYRNVIGPCGSGFNTTNAFTVTFTP